MDNPIFWVHAPVHPEVFGDARGSAGAFTPLQGVSSKGHDRFNGQGCCQGEGIHPRRAMEREEIAAAGWRERKRRERRAPTTCGCTGALPVVE